MTRRRSSVFVVCWLCGVSCAIGVTAAEVRPENEVRLEKVVSHEDAKFDIARSRLTVGRDGRLYFAAGESLLRMERDGSQRAGARMPAAMTRGTANAKGIIGTGHGHFTHAVKTWRPDFSEIGAVSEFLNNDQVQYFAPTDVQAGSTDFFGYDTNRNRIVRVSPEAKLLTTYPLEAAGLNTITKLARFRVWETGQQFYVRFENSVTCVGFDGKKRWQVELGAAGNPWDGWRDVIEVDDTGRLLVLAREADVIKIFDAEGRPAGEVRLKRAASDGKPSERRPRVEDLAVWQDELFVKLDDPVELCAVFDRETGDFKRSLTANVEIVSATLPSAVWTAGERVPVTISRESSAGISDGKSQIADSKTEVSDPQSKTERPDPQSKIENQKSKIKNRLWLRPFNTPEFSELPLVDGQVVVPADLSGLFHLRISPDLRGAGSADQLDTVVEIRVPNAKGSVSIFTPLNRLYFGQGESISVSVVTRTPFPDELPRQWRVRLQPSVANAAAKAPLFERFVLTSVDRPDTFQIPAFVTRTFPPGRYVLTAEAAGFTVAPQFLEIGNGIEVPPKFSLVQHGDYSSSFPLGSDGRGTLFDIPDLVADHVRTTRLLNQNLFADRIGLAGAGVKHLVMENVPTDELAARLASDPLGVAPEKARIENVLRQTVAARGAFGQEQRGIFLMMDAGLPLGTGFDGRSAEQREQDLREVNEALQSYPAFRGWSWAANWWLGNTGTSAAKDHPQKAEYQAALQKVKETGEWSPVLDKVSDSLFAHAVSAERELTALQFKHSPNRLMVSSMTGPYRAVHTHPPIIFQNADEVDLHYQMEQIQPPSWTAHAVDFLKRPNKRAWGHPEIWNDDGTGGMLLPTILPMFLRGAEGVGWSGRPHDWTPTENDSRAGGPGLLSMLRALNELLTVYGPWQTTLENRDRIAIVVSTRMQRISGWHGHLGSKYHEQLFEAYNACLYAHRPAKFVFVEDLKPDSFQHVQAVLVVGQQVALDPPLVEALAAVKKTGARIFHDGTCRSEVVQDKFFEPLGMSFDRISSYDGELAQDDSLYVRMPRWFFDHAEELRKVLADVTPVAKCHQPEVLLFERFSGDARFVWVLNNTPMLETNPGQAWRTSLMMSQRAPVCAFLNFMSGDDPIYDVFAHRQVRPAAGAMDSHFAEPLDRPVLADLRSTPLRLYAILPKKPHRITVEAQQRGGLGLEWTAKINDADGQPINANLPIRLTAVGQDRKVLSDSFASTKAGEGASGVLTVPARSGGTQISVTINELLTPLDRADVERVRGSRPYSGTRGWEYRFGPHFKELAVSADGKTGLLNAFNWHENVFMFDIENGKRIWRQRIGDHFTYSPQAVGEGFAIQGFDKRTAEGYHLYLLDTKGEAAHRFALFGLPKRATSWSNGSHVLDRGINSFAVSPDGTWVAAAGDLGLTVWSREGEVKWSDVPMTRRAGGARVVSGMALAAGHSPENVDPESPVASAIPLKESGKALAAGHTPEDVDPESPVASAIPLKARCRLLFVPDSSTLLTAVGRTVTAYQIEDGKQLWTCTVAPTGQITGGQLSADGKTLAIKTDTDGGRVLIIRDQQIIGTIFTPADVALPSPDGQFLAVTHDRVLKWYSATGHLQWQFTGDEFLRNPAISADGSRIAVCSELGSLITLSSKGEVLLDHDLRSLATLKFLANGDLLAATWTGNVVRLRDGIQPLWSNHFSPFKIWMLKPGEEKKPGGMNLKFDFDKFPNNEIWMGWPITKDVPTTRMAGWGNAASEPAPLVPNLLADTKALVQAVCEPTTHGDPRDWKQPIELLTDGQPEPPARPWLEWSDINYIDSGWRQKLTIVTDSFREQLKVTGVTIAEDPQHPESWWRDVRLQWWDATAETWRDGPRLLWDAGAKANTLDEAFNAKYTKAFKALAQADDALPVIIETKVEPPPEDDPPKDEAKKTDPPTDAPPKMAAVNVIHTHWFDKPIEAAKFRFVSTGGGTWPVGNLRMGELVFHGERLGASHPDAVAKKPVAVLFDENETDLRSSFKHAHNPQFDFLYDGAFSGGKCLSLKQAGQAGALFRPPFGHAIPNWNFEIAEHPQPGQFRWLQFAWRATSPQTTSLGLLLGRNFPAGGYAITCGTANIREGAVATKTIEGAVPTDWQLIQVDLWELFHKEPLRIQSLTLHSTGGGAAFDQIVLGKSKEELPAPPK